MPNQNRSACGNTVTEKSGKSKQSKVTRVELRAGEDFHGLFETVTVSRKSIPEMYEPPVRKTTTNITKTSWSISQAKYQEGRGEMTKVPIKK